MSESKIMIAVSLGKDRTEVCKLTHPLALGYPPCLLDLYLGGLLLKISTVIPLGADTLACA